MKPHNIILTVIVLACAVVAVTSPETVAQPDTTAQEELDWLLECIPLEYAVELRVVNLTEDWGSSDWDEERKIFVMEIAKNSPPFKQRDTVWHEYAHLMRWWKGDRSDHGPAWGRAYARCYRAATGVP